MTGAGWPLSEIRYALCATARPDRSPMFSPSVSWPFTFMPGSGLNALYCCTSAPARLEALVVVSRPPVGEHAVAIGLATLIVECVDHLVADHAADAAVVDRHVGMRIEEWRLQDGRWEHDLVRERVVVGIDRLRRHAPLGLVHRLADLGQFALRVGLTGVHHVADEVVLADGEPRILLPLGRVADLHREIADLVFGGLARLGTHPVEFADTGVECLQQVLHQLVHATLRLRREVSRDVFLAEQVADRSFELAEGALPARLQLRRTRQRVAIEVEASLTNAELRYGAKLSIARSFR